MTHTLKNTVLYIVVPCYNESEVLHESAAVLSEKLRDLITENSLSPLSKILFVDDGSTDGSWQIIRDLCKTDPGFLGISLAHNRGHQNALYAGLMYAKDHADVSISIDADLQQDVEAMDRFLAEYGLGSEIVYGVRNSRDTDSRSKKDSADDYYSLMRACGADILKDAADYRLLSRKALDALSEYKESNLFLRGIVCNIGLKSSIVKFDVSPRKAGKSKYTFRKMMHLALDGLTSFTHTPLHVILISGIICVLLSILFLLYVLICRVITHTSPAYAPVLFSIWLVGGLIMVSLGIVGEYIGRISTETKHRPRYFIDDVCVENKDISR